MSITITYKIKGSGWAEASLSNHTQSITMIVSYVSDALGDLSKAIVSLLSGSHSEKVSFLDEPGEYQFHFQRNNDGILLIKVIHLDDWSNLRSESNVMKKGEEVFTGETSLIDFSEQVKFILEKLLKELGIEGYREAWVEYDFPLQTLVELRQLLFSTRHNA